MDGWMYNSEVRGPSQFAYRMNGVITVKVSKKFAATSRSEQSGIITPEQEDDRSNESGVNMNKMPIPQNPKCNQDEIIIKDRKQCDYLTRLNLRGPTSPNCTSDHIDLLHAVHEQVDSAKLPDRDDRTAIWVGARHSCYLHIYRALTFKTSKLRKGLGAGRLQPTDRSSCTLGARSRSEEPLKPSHRLGAESQPFGGWLHKNVPVCKRGQYDLTYKRLFSVQRLAVLRRLLFVDLPGMGETLGTELQPVQPAESLQHRSTIATTSKRIEIVKLYYSLGVSATAALRGYKTKHGLIKDLFIVSTITRLIAKFDSTGFVLNFPGKGRKSLSDERAPIVQNAVEQLQSQSTMASSSITQVSQLTDIPRASKRSIIRRHLHLYPYHFNKMALHPTTQTK
ncbi:hypothetical protein CLF_100832 [Clonorchis sinensis]|uniref:Uncharacterized protein n=1 Tax=Clonorchis sinensis TaxID=79923 RepID=G7Y4C7_CLOSI|nr:hypothetical protein CLF_100832 [Clonorchis sinensis]